MEPGKLETTNCNVGQKGGPCPKSRQNVNQVKESRKNKAPRLKIQVGSVKFSGLLDSGAGRSLINTDVFNRIKNEIKYYNAEAPVDLYGVENTRLTTRGLITLEISVLGDNLLQDFIVVDGISEECILGLDALYEHKFIIDGSERKIYRVKKTTLPDSAPTIMTGKKITIKPFSATVVESEGNGAQLPPNLAFYLNRGPGLNSGLRLDPFISNGDEGAVFSIAVVNETNKPITLPKYELIGTLDFSRVKKEHVNSCTVDEQPASR